MHNATAADSRTLVTNVVRVAERLVRVKDARGATIHLDIEPEPDCMLENTPETLNFFVRLWTDGAPELATRLGCTVDQARGHLKDHIRLCFDCCHFSVEHEDPAAALKTLQQAGIEIGRVQLSSALQVSMPQDPEARGLLLDRLRPFADSTYLHQVIRRGGGPLEHFPDLDAALSAAGPGDWRVHFHVPLFTSDYDQLRSTQDDVRRVLATVRETRATRHLEIETYTWDVLPADLKIDLLDSIGREYEWVLSVWGS
jgi:hypothetical protein